MVSVAKLRTYLVDPPDDDETLAMFLNAAKQKAAAAGVPEYADNAYYDIFILSLAAMLYDNRGMGLAVANQNAAEESARRLINAFTLELRNGGG